MSSSLGPDKTQYVSVGTFENLCSDVYNGIVLLKAGPSTQRNVRYLTSRAQNSPPEPRVTVVVMTGRPVGDRETRHTSHNGWAEMVNATFRSRGGGKVMVVERLVYNHDGERLIRRVLIQSRAQSS